MLRTNGVNILVLGLGLAVVSVHLAHAQTFAGPLFAPPAPTQTFATCDEFLNSSFADKDFTIAQAESFESSLSGPNRDNYSQYLDRSRAAALSGEYDARDVQTFFSYLSVSVPDNCVSSQRIIAEGTSSITQRSFARTVRRTIGARIARLAARLSRTRTDDDDDKDKDKEARRSGVAAGDAVMDISLWGDAQGGFDENVSTGLRQDGNFQNANVGADVILGEKLIVGVSLAYERLHSEFAVVEGTVDHMAGSIVPYAAYIINDYLNITALFGYARTRTNLEDRFSGPLATAEIDANRFTGSVSLTGQVPMGNWLFTGMGGYLGSLADSESFTNSAGVRYDPDTTRLGQLNAFVEVRYRKDAFEPYVFIDGEYDVLTNLISGFGGVDLRFGVLFGGGLDWTINDKFSLGFEASTLQLRTIEENYAVGANLVYRY